MIEWFLTQMGRRRTSRYLEFARRSDIAPPRPDPEQRYLLYIHIPFCEVLCPYCSFNRIPFEKNLAKRYFDALLKEMEHYRTLGYIFESIYLGGGTPTVLPDRLQEVLDCAGRFWPIQNISVETNPNHLNDATLKILTGARVKRLSVGVQTFDDDLLKLLKRFDKYGSGNFMFEQLSRVQGVFDTLNIDMIFNFPTQTEKQVRSDLEVVAALRPDQVTWYPLMASKLKKHEMSEALGKTDYRNEKRLYTLIREGLPREYRPASAWCFSKNAALIDEYIVDYREYAGLGSGSFGYLQGTLYSNTFSVPGYIRRLEAGLLPLAGRRDFSLKEMVQYELLMSLFGGDLSLSRFEKRFGAAGLRTVRPALAALTLAGAVEKEGDTLITTDKGKYYLVILMREFFNGVNTLREQRLKSDTL